jgi:hypothetical protein
LTKEQKWNIEQNRNQGRSAMNGFVQDTLSLLSIAMFVAAYAMWASVF